MIGNIDLALTSRCNASCEFCFARGGGAPPMGDMTEEVFAGVLDWLDQESRPPAGGGHKGGKLKVYWLGAGEPTLLWPRLIDWSARLKVRLGQRLSHIGMPTNGGILTRELADQWKAMGNTMRLSTEGPPTDGKLRGLPAEVVERNFRLMVERGWSDVRSTIYPGNVRQLAESVAYLRGLGCGRPSVHMAPELDWSADDMAAFDAQLREVSDMAIAAYRDGERLLPAYAHRGLQQGGREPDSCISCGAGSSYIAIDANGAFAPCHRWTSDGPPVDMGNVWDGLKLDAWQQAAKPARACEDADCPARQACSGACAWIRQTTSGRLDGPTPAMYCHGLRAFVREAQYIREALGDNKQFRKDMKLDKPLVAPPKGGDSGPLPRGFYVPNIAKEGPPRRLIIIRRQGYRKSFTDALIPALVSGGWAVEEYWLNEIGKRKLYGLPEIVASKEQKPDAVLRWEEHGCLFATRPWQAAVNWLYDRDIAPLSVDLGYFDHYNALMFDRYERDGTSCIRNRWEGLSPNSIDWTGVHVQIRDYWHRKQVEWEECKLRDPVAEPGYVAVWPQFSHSLCRFKPAHVNEWLQRVNDALMLAGKRVLFKGSPVQKTDIKFPRDATVVGHKDLKDKPWLNTLIQLHAAWHVTICSSVTNEMVVHGLPVTCTGRSWFQGLRVFYEPDDWEALAVKPELDPGARNRWIRWWIERQFHVSEAVKHLHFMLKEYWQSAEAPVDTEAAAGLDYGRIYDHVYDRNPVYHRGSMQLELAHAMLEEIMRHEKVHTLLDVGCGEGQLVEWAREKKAFADGLDAAAIERSHGQPKWYHVADCRKIPWPDDKFDVVTSLDMLEHLHPDHVAAAVAEMKRVSRKWVLIGVGCGPSRTDWDMPKDVDKLHLTVKDWRAWLTMLRQQGLKLRRAKYESHLKNAALFRVD